MVFQLLTNCLYYKHKLLVFIVACFLLTDVSGITTYARTEPNPSSSTGYPEGGLRRTDWEDMLPHTMQGSYYNEFWSYHVFLENELHLHITFSLANFGSLKSAVSGGKLFVSNFKGNNYNILREFTLEKFVIDEALQKIRLHPGREIYLKGALPDTHYLHYETTKDDVSYLVKLHFHDIHPGYTSGDGIFRIDGNETGVFVHIPKASVSGTVAINEDTLEVNGTAYMDHTYQTDLSSKIVEKGFRHISHTEEGYNIGYYLIPKNRDVSGMIGLGLHQNPTGTTRLEQPDRITVVEYSDIDGRSVPEKIIIEYLSGLQKTLERTREFQHVSFLQEIGGLRRRLVRAFLGGEVIEYVGTGKIDAEIPVNYNFFIVH